MIAIFRTLVVQSSKAPWRSLHAMADRSRLPYSVNGILNKSAATPTMSTIRTRTIKSSLTTKTYHAQDTSTATSDTPLAVPITFIEEDADGSSAREIEVQAVVGKHLLDAAHDNNVELEGACGGELACSTCHLVFEQEIYDKLPPKTDDEDDMLDLAFSVTETSRLGCQIPVKEEYAGMKLRIPYDRMTPNKDK